MSAELIAGTVGLLISLVLSYVPGISPAWDKLDGTKKRFITGLLVVGTGVIVYAVGCQEVYTVPLSCPDPWTLAGAVLAALVANQSAYQLTKG
jgi:hypothetical protein